MQNETKNIPTFINKFKTIGFDDQTFIALLQLNFATLFLEGSAIEKVAQNLLIYSNQTKVQQDIVLVKTVTKLFVEQVDNPEDVNEALWFLVEIACSHLRSTLSQDQKKTVVGDIIAAGEASNNDLEQLREFSRALLDFLDA